ncbi:MipA/OmpV family protein [Phaeobacter gallaeciensis]|uniref:Outer membrane protein V n=1 Tax=Phaeobacter gallaeciensis TaxID=60890 RepID=A0AAD0EDL4_9RHOB|nr:MipA/OmpV family protein [Phaeobacter gallaeciensis]AHD10133.1 Outer membrane protein V [Phaeobacter gallaeciensis DSM 26640]ATE93397.1 Outer membrane protein V [Phaeobacter gallaeciensis]ATE96782.1 Outer membrane protein V [Phaeobacter gallaeciensis]ATF02061.1 Outer membrane protein V [Phaeobacter gallaeciensis]ATF06441.1 Outer membrane protein V [Phaeobacter gallaeciensis]
MNYYSAIITSLSAATTLTAAMPASGQDKPWEFDIEIGVDREPSYVGSDEYTTEADFGIQATYTAPNETQWYVSTGGLGVLVPMARDYELTLELEYEPGRSNSDDPILAGFPKMENTWEFQTILTRQFGDFTVGAGLQQDILGNGKGLVGFIGAGYSRQLTERLRVKTALDISFANAEHMNTEVGISTATSQATGLAAYKPSGGYKGTSLSLGFDYAVSRKTALYADFSVERYGSEIADSPLVSTHGSKVTTELAAGVRFNF